MRMRLIPLRPAPKVRPSRRRSRDVPSESWHWEGEVYGLGFGNFSQPTIHRAPWYLKPYLYSICRVPPKIQPSIREPPKIQAKIAGAGWLMSHRVLVWTGAKAAFVRLSRGRSYGSFAIRFGVLISWCRLCVEKLRCCANEAGDHACMRSAQI